jgi:hypothetical protein
MAFVLDTTGNGVSLPVEGTVPVCPTRPEPDLSGPPDGNVAINWASLRVTYNHGVREVWVTAITALDRFPLDQITSPMKGNPDGKWHTYLHVGGMPPTSWYQEDPPEPAA